LWVRAKGDVEVNEGKPARIYGTFQDITQQKRVRDQIKKLNEDLERRVVERTSQLELVNHELESFSYSISHDLRAPLRSISGYSLAVIEDYGAQLDQEASRLLGKVINNARRMGQLIDDLLEFSRLGRQSLSRTELNMNEFVHQIADEIVSGAKGQPIDLNIKPLCNVQGDFSMIRQVWINLLSNALKYSEKKQKPTIEIGCIESNKSKKTFYVRDNGAGFDMAYSHKLFGVFQRLHKEQEFEGTGVGLALTKRIIEKHGGEIWAEARVNEGATFYFTLPTYEQVNVA
jgi:light-regulated signal transduction histidine kinase (bacteriophytochrome)